MILKTQINFRIDQNMNMSVASEHIINDETEAAEAGRKDATIYSAYIEGYGNAIPDDS